MTSGPISVAAFGAVFALLLASGEAGAVYPDASGAEIGEAGAAIGTARPGRMDGSVQIQGSFETTGVGEVIDLTSPISVSFTDAASLAATAMWSKTDCHRSPSGAVRCQGADGRSLARFKPTSTGYTFLVKMRGLANELPAAAPVRAHLHQGNADRIATLSTCTVTGSKAVCGSARSR